LKPRSGNQKVAGRETSGLVEQDLFALKVRKEGLGASAMGDYLVVIIPDVARPATLLYAPAARN